MDFDAVVLAGGSGARLGGVDKGAIEVGGVRLLDRVLAAAGAAARTVVVGPARPVQRPVTWASEQPPGGGPVAGLAAGLDALDALDGGPSRPVLVLATDLPRITSADVDRLVSALAAAPGHVDAVQFADAGGRAQPLAAIYRQHALARALAAEQPVHGLPMRAILARLAALMLPDQGAAADCDTPEQLRRARSDHERRGRGRPAMDDQTLPGWVATVCTAMDLDPGLIDVAAVLDLAKDAAHGVARPAAPLTTFMAGLLIGRELGAAPGADAAAITRQVFTGVTALVPAPPDLDAPAR